MKTNFIANVRKTVLTNQV